MSELRDKVARKLEPRAWSALATGDLLAYRNRRTSSLRTADAILAIPEISAALKPVCERCGKESVFPIVCVECAEQ